MSDTVSRRILVVSPFTHQNGHFVTFPRDVCCGLAASGHDVTLVHARPFASDLDWFGHPVKRICLKDSVASAPWWWRELWHRLAARPSNQCLAWLIWKVKPSAYDLVFWTDFQAQNNVWPMTIARALRLYRLKSAFAEHHPPETEGRYGSGRSRRSYLSRMRVAGLPMIVFSRAHLDAWKAHLGANTCVAYVPYGVWPTVLNDDARRKARRELHIDQDALVLLVFGVQAIKRKNIDTLHEALRGYSPKRHLTLLFVGRVPRSDAHPFSDWQSTEIDVTIDNRFVSDCDVTRYFAASDFVWANYRNFPGASGVLLQTMGFGRVSIACNSGEIGELCSEYRLGLLASSSTVEATREALDQAAAIRPEELARWEGDLGRLAARFAWPVIAKRLVAEILH